MTAATLTLTDFLLQRIADDEAVARGVPLGEKFCVASSTENISNRITLHATHFDPARVLAECAAKRAIVARATYYANRASVTPCAWDHTLYDLAGVYADHADFDPRWVL